MFFKLLWYDIRVGVLRKKRKLLAVAAVFTGACVSHQMRLSSYRAADLLHPIEDTLGNTMLSILGGMPEYSATGNKPFTFPVVWLMLYLLPAYLTLYYPQQDLEESGQNLLIRTGGRSLWWLSKCLWNIIMVLVFWGTGYLILALFCAMRGIPFSMGISENIPYFLNLENSRLWQLPRELNLELWVLPVLVTETICLLQMTVSLYIRPIFSFMVIGVLLLSSAYYQSSYLPGNYIMPVRSSRIILGGIDPVQGILFSLVFMAVSFVAGLIRFRYYDILKRE